MHVCAMGSKASSGKKGAGRADPELVGLAGMAAVLLDSASALVCVSGSSVCWPACWAASHLADHHAHPAPELDYSSAAAAHPFSFLLQAGRATYVSTQ